jgi:hypothetical protein
MANSYNKMFLEIEIWSFTIYDQEVLVFLIGLKH